MSKKYIEAKKTIDDQVVKLIDSKDDMDLYTPVNADKPVFLVRRYSGEVILIADQVADFGSNYFPSISSGISYKLSVILPK